MLANQKLRTWQTQNAKPDPFDSLAAPNDTQRVRNNIR
jgi:hypothetical protein